MVSVWHVGLPTLSIQRQPPLLPWTHVKIIRYLALFLATTCGCAMADDWRSPVEVEFEKNKPALYKEYHQARTLLDGYRGKRTDMQLAYRLLLGVQKKDKNLAPVLRELGRFYIIASHFGDDRFDERTLKIAEDSILRSISVEPTYEDAYVLLGHLYTKMNQYQQADTALIQASALGSKSPWLKLNRADIYVKTERFDEAQALAQEVIDSGTSNAKAETTAHQLKINTLSALGKLDAVKRAHEALLLAQPKEALHWGNYANLLMYSYNDSDGAITAAKNALNIMDYQSARLTMAIALYTKWANISADPTRKDEAELIYKKALRFFTDQNKVIEIASKNTATKEVASKLAAFLNVYSP